MHIRKAPITHSDELFLFALYSTTRQAELANVPWNEEQKQAFLKMQFQAQNQHYTTKFPNASFLLLSIDDQPVGRLYTAEFEDEIRILDLTLAPDFRNKKIGSQLLEEILQDAQSKNKSVQIYLEDFNQAKNLFSRLGFEVAAEEGFYQLWRWSANITSSEKAIQKSGIASSQAGI